MTRRGDTTPAREVFARFLQRLEERVAYVAELLKNEKFEFSGEDRYQLDRRQAPFPKDLDEAHRLWRQHLRYEVLQEILNQKPPAAGKTAEATKPAEPRFTANGLPEGVVQTLTRRYARILWTLSGFDGADVFQLYLGALTHVYDPHSDYMGKATLENFCFSRPISSSTSRRGLSQVRPVPRSLHQLILARAFGALVASH